MGGGAGHTTRMAGQTYSAAAVGAVQRQNNKELCYAETGARQQAAAGDSPEGLPKQIKTKIQFMVQRTNIKINSTTMRFSKGMMEMKRNKTDKEPKKQNTSVGKRVALEEEDRVKLDRYMTEPEHKVWTIFYKNPHVVYSPCHPFTVSSVHHVINSPSWSMPSIYHVIH